MNCIKFIKDWIKEKYSIHKQTQDNLTQLNIMRQKHEFCTCAQLHLQTALGGILKESTISSKLCSIQYPSDLLIRGYQIQPSGTEYSFEWIKSDINHFFSITACRILVNKINSAIQTAIMRYNAELQFLDDYQRQAFINSNPALNNGFRVLNVTDNVDSIILKVAYT